MLDVFANLPCFTLRATGASSSVKGGDSSHRVVPSPAKLVPAALFLLLGFCLSAVPALADATQAYELREGNSYTVTVKGPNVTVVDGNIHVLIQTPYTITISATAGYGWKVVQPNPNPSLPFEVKYINSPELGVQQVGDVKFKKLDGAEAVVGTPVKLVVDAEIKLLGKRLVTHDPDYEGGVVLALPGKPGDVVAQQVKVMHNNQVKVLAKVPADCTVSLGNKTAWPLNNYWWKCDAEDAEATEGDLDVYYFMTNHPSTPDACDEVGGIKVNKSTVFSGSYIVAIRQKDTNKMIKSGETLKVGPMLTRLAFTQAIDKLAPNSTDKMNTMCPYTYSVKDVQGNTGYGLAINYTLKDVASKMEFKSMSLG